MSGSFTQGELEEMGKPTIDLLNEAIDMGDKERAKKLARRMHSEFLVMHDLYVDWLAEFMDYVYRNYGDNALYQALRRVVRVSMAPMVELTKLDLRHRVQRVAFMLRGHLQPMKLEEDDEKVCITMEPCGSGQRLLQKGAYDSPRNLTVIQRPQAITWGRGNFPIYCTHCPVLEILSVEELGYPLMVTFPAEKVAQKPCRICLYKSAEGIPREVYARIGK